MGTIEFILVSTVLAVITLLGLLGTIHLTLNICGCRQRIRICRHCRKSQQRRSVHGTTILGGRSKNHTVQISQSQGNDFNMDDDDDDDDDPHKSLASKTNLVCVLTVLCFQLFLFVSCYQQLTLAYTPNGPLHILQCRVLFCLIAFYVYGKTLLYCYFVCRAYNMLENSQLNYSKRTVVAIVCTYFIMMSSILFLLIYVHFNDDFCMVEHVRSYSRQRTLVCAALGLMDVAMAMMSVSLLVQKLFALVRESMTVRGFSSITPGAHIVLRASPLPMPTTLRASASATSLRSNSHMQRPGAPGATVLLRPSSLSHSLQQQQRRTSFSQNQNQPRDLRRVSSTSFTPPSERRLSLKSRVHVQSKTTGTTTRQTASGNESASGGEESAEQTPEHTFKMPSTEAEDLKECEGDDDEDDELQSIVSNEILMDVDINKVKKLSIGQLMQEAELMQLTQTQTTDPNSGDDEPIAEHNGVDHADDVDAVVMMALDDDDDDDSDDEDEMKESSPIINLKSKQQRPPLSRSLPRPSASSTTKTLNIEIGASPRGVSTPSHRSVPSQSLPSLERRASSILELVRRRSEIASTISNQHIARFHQCTMYDNEMLLLSTKLLILLTVCVVSAFCAFLLMFVVIRFNDFNPNNGIFLVYGVDAFVNIWCLAFTFKFSNHCYNVLFNCGDAQRCTKCCFPWVKTAALTWKCCAKNEKMGVLRHGSQPNDSKTRPARSCHLNCCFCVCGNEQELQIYVMAKGEVKMMVAQNRKLYQ